MILKGKTILLGLQILLAAFALTAAVAAPLLAGADNTAPAQTTAQRCKNFHDLFKIGSGNTTSNVADNLPQLCSASSLITTAISGSLIFAGAIAVFFLIEGGYFYMISGGNEETAEKGKKMIINSVVGLAVILMAFAIVRIVYNTLTGG